MSEQTPRRAARIAAMPEPLREMFAPFAHIPDMPELDISPEARAARIAALQGEIPEWAKGDPENDPELIRAREAQKPPVDMSDLRPFPLDPIPDAAPSEKKPESAREFMQRLRDPARWKSALYDLIVWFLLGWLLTQAVSTYSPGYPMVVGTPSIPMGLYWLTKHPATLQRGDLVSFPFEPTQPWLKGRYGHDLVHTKFILGMAGDTVYADSDLRLRICHPQGARGLPAVCETAGQVQTRDSKGRPLVSWVPRGYQYTLQNHELWVYSPHPLSLDSRYHGPIQEAIVYGRASPVFLVSGQQLK